jgi:hypothetical protein
VTVGGASFCGGSMLDVREQSNGVCRHLRGCRKVSAYFSVVFSSDKSGPPLAAVRPSARPPRASRAPVVPHRHQRFQEKSKSPLPTSSRPDQQPFRPSPSLAHNRLLELPVVRRHEGPRARALDEVCGQGRHWKLHCGP